MMTAPPFNVKNQVAFCGVTCGTCGQGSGKAASTAKKVLDLINAIDVKNWAPTVPGGAELDWAPTEKTLEWMTKNTYCIGCEKGGGSPDCVIRICARGQMKGIGGNGMGSHMRGQGRGSGGNCGSGQGVCPNVTG